MQTSQAQTAASLMDSEWKAFRSNSQNEAISDKDVVVVVAFSVVGWLLTFVTITQLPSARAEEILRMLSLLQ
jgi:hypothetical protein